MAYCVFSPVSGEATLLLLDISKLSWLLSGSVISTAPIWKEKNQQIRKTMCAV